MELAAEAESDQLWRLPFGGGEASRSNHHIFGNGNAGVGARGKRFGPGDTSSIGIESLHIAVGGGREDEIVGDGREAEGGRIGEFVLPLDGAGLYVESNEFSTEWPRFLTFGLADDFERAIHYWHEHRLAISRHRCDHATEGTRINKHWRLQLRRFTPHRQ